MEIVTKYLRVTGSEAQINSLVNLAKSRRFKAVEVNVIQRISCGGNAETHEKNNDIHKDVDKLAMDDNTFAEGCGCSICRANYILGKNLEYRLILGTEK